MSLSHFTFEFTYAQGEEIHRAVMAITTTEDEKTAMARTVRFLRENRAPDVERLELTCNGISIMEEPQAPRRVRLVA